MWELAAIPPIAVMVVSDFRSRTVGVWTIGVTCVLTAAAAVAGALPCVCLLAGEAVSVCKTARFAIQNVPFRKLKRTVSQPPVSQLVVCSGRKALPQGVDVVRRQPCSGAPLECGLCVGGLGKAVAACRGRAGRGRRRAARLILQRGSRLLPICPRRPCR